MVTIPSSLRRRLDIEAGDKLRWHIDEGEFAVEIVRQRFGAYEDDDVKAPMDCDSLETHDRVGHREDPRSVRTPE